MNGTRSNQRKHLVLLLLLTLGMFGFAFALVPLYDVFCDLTGLNGKASGLLNSRSQTARDSDPASPSQQSSGREVTIQFLASVGNGLPWEFRPLQRLLRVRVGEMHSTRFYVRNRADQAVTNLRLPGPISSPVTSGSGRTSPRTWARRPRPPAGDSWGGPRS